ncbi:hypothetical protein BKI52_33145 [marine bacterium AO1-C]|nr:hypothetical protein BKI52_33145 [marine bacterium AO1-C]
MKVSINISNSKTILSPVIYRAVEAKIEPHYLDFTLVRVDIVCKVYQYINIERTEAFALQKHYQRVLKIKASTIVDSRNGNYVDTSLPEGHPDFVPVEFRIDELKHFMKQKNLSIEEALEGGILRADSQNKFD